MCEGVQNSIPVHTPPAHGGYLASCVIPFWINNLIRTLLVGYYYIVSYL